MCTHPQPDTDLTPKEETPEFQFALQMRLMPLLTQQIRLFTRGQSSSVPVEIAEELYCSLCHTLATGLHARQLEPQALLCQPLQALFCTGQQQLKLQQARLFSLLQAVLETLSPLPCDSLQTSLQSIRDALPRYDLRFFAHRIPGCVDYQPLCPVGALEGLDYLEEYLSLLLCENRILAAFPAAQEHLILLETYGDYAAQPLNLAEPIVEEALGLMLADGDAAALQFTPKKRDHLLNLCLPCTQPELVTLLQDAGLRLCSRMNWADNRTQACIGSVAQNLAGRVFLTLQRGSLGQLFGI